MLFVDYSSAFITVIPHKLSQKLLTLIPSICNWVLNFLSDSPQTVRIGHRALELSTGTNQCCVLTWVLFTLLTYDCVTSENNTSIGKFCG